MSAYRVTLSGIDESASLRRLIDNMALMPVEVELAVQFNEAYAGTRSRFPAHRFFERFLHLADNLPDNVYTALHLSGQDAIDSFITNEGFANDLSWDFNRCQLNVDRVAINPEALAKVINQNPDFQIIVPYNTASASLCRYLLNNTLRTHILFDESGGQGRLPAIRPESFQQARATGYGGGFNINTIEDEVRRIEQATLGRYWIDVQSGVRNSVDEFDVELAETFVKKVGALSRPQRPQRFFAAEPRYETAHA
jgi:hypothetical protein